MKILGGIGRRGLSGLGRYLYLGVVCGGMLSGHLQMET